MLVSPHLYLAGSCRHTPTQKHAKAIMMDQAINHEEEGKTNPSGGNDDDEEPLTGSKNRILFQSYGQFRDT